MGEDDIIEAVAKIIFNRHSAKHAQDGRAWETMTNEFERCAYLETARLTVHAVRDGIPGTPIIRTRDATDDILGSGKAK